MPARLPGGGGRPKKDELEVELAAPSFGPSAIIAARGGPAFASDETAAPSMTIRRSWLQVARELVSGVPEVKTGKPGSLQRDVRAESPVAQAREAAQFVQSNADAINWRLRNANPDNVALAPGMYWQAVMNRQSDKRQQKTVEALDAVVPWLLQKTKFAGEGGAMAGARLYAIQTQNQTALAFLDALDGLDPTAQRVLLETLRNPTVGGSGTVGGVTFAMPGATQEETDALRRANLYLSDTFGITQAWDEDGNTVYALPNEDRGVDTLVALKTLFPTNPWLQEARIKGPDGWDRFLVNPSDQLLSVGAAAALEGIELATLPLMAGIEGYKGVLRAAAGLGTRLGAGDLPKGQQEQITAQAAGIAGTPVDLFNEGFRYFDEGVRWSIHNTVMHLVSGGVTPETREQLESALSGLTEFWILGKVSRVGRAFKASRTSVDAAAQLGIEKPFGETSFSRTRTGEPGAMDSGFYHPLRAATDLANRAGYELGMRKFKDVRGLVNEHTPIQETFDWIAEVNGRHTGAEFHDARVGIIRSALGDNIPVALIERLADTPRGAMEEVFLDRIMNRPEKVARAATLSALVKRQGLELQQLAPESVVRMQMERVAEAQRAAAEARSGAAPPAEPAAPVWEGTLEDAQGLVRRPRDFGRIDFFETAGEKAWNRFTKPWDEWKDRLSQEDLDIIEHYVSLPTEEYAVRRVKELFNEAPRLTRPVRTWRGWASNPEEITNVAPGDIIERGSQITSVSVDKSIAAGGYTEAGGPGAVEVLLPKGFPAIEPGGGPMFGTEYQLLLPPDVRLMVLEATPEGVATRVVALPDEGLGRVAEASPEAVSTATRRTPSGREVYQSGDWVSFYGATNRPSGLEMLEVMEDVPGGRVRVREEGGRTSEYNRTDLNFLGRTRAEADAQMAVLDFESQANLGSYFAENEPLTPQGQEALALQEKLRPALEAARTDLERVRAEAVAAEGPAPVAPNEALAQQYEADAARLLSELDTVREQAVALRLQRTYNQSELLKLTGDLDGTPAYEYPRHSAIKAFVEGEGAGAGDFAATAFGRSIRSMARKFVDVLPRYPELYTPWGGRESRPMDWVEHNVDTATKYLQRAGVGDGLTFDLAGELARVRTRSDFYDWAARAADAVDKALPASTPTEMRAELTRWFQHPLEERGRLSYGKPGVDVDGNPTTANEPIVGRSDPLDPTARPASLPSSPTDFLGSFHLPSVDMLIDARGWYGRVLRACANHRLRGGIAVEAAFKLVRGLFSLGTTIWKAPILALRVLAMTERIQLEQALRAHLFGGYRAVALFPKGLAVSAGFVDGFIQAMGGPRYGAAFEVLKPDPRYASFEAPTEQSLGGIHSQLTGERGSAEYTTVDTTLLNSRLQVPSDGHYTATAETLQKVFSDYFDKRFIEGGMDVDAAMQLIAGGRLFPEYVRSQLEVLRSSDLATSAAGKILSDEAMIRRWLENKAASFRELFDRAPNAEGAVRSGVYGAELADRTMASVDPISGIPNQTILTERTAEMLSAREALRGLKDKDRLGDLTEEERVRLIALERQTRALRSEVGRLGELTAGEVPGGAVPLESTAAVAALMKKEYAAGQFDFPRELSVKRRYAATERSGIMETGAKFRQAWNEAWYKPFRVVSAADMRLTRGGVYYQMADHYYRGLMERGYANADARAFAQIKASNEVRDLMYDLSARTSVQRGLKDTFWFASAFQEVLYTWLVKIPSQEAFRLGYFTIPARAKALLNALRTVGVVQTVTTPSGDQEVIPVSGVAALIDKILPGDQTFGSRISFTLAGLNLVSSSPIPGLATIPGWALGKAANEWGTVFKGLSDVFNQYGSEITATPRQIMYGWEYLTGNPWPLEFLSPDYAKAQYDRAYDQALQYAFSQRIAAGDLQPRPEDFATPEAYQEARDAWSKGLFQEADTYFKGVAGLRLAGSATTPASLTVSDPERADFQEFFARMVEPLGNREAWGIVPVGATNAYTEAQRQMLDQYVARHPESLAYTIGYSVYGEKQRELPYESTGDQAFFDEFLTGERRILSPDDFAQKLMTVESYRYYNGQRNAALRGIDDDASTLLVHGGERIDALTHFTENWDRFLAYNPKANAVLEESKRAWQERYGIPANTYEVSRLADTISYLSQMSPVFTGESGMLDSEFRDTLSKLKALYSDTAMFGEPTTQVGKDMAWYYDTVLDPYFAQTEELYLEAEHLNARGEDASAVYDKIRAINDSFTDAQLTHSGQVFPTPEEVFFGNKNEAAQAAAKLNWTTKPPTWLTDFQTETVGAISDFEGRDALYSRISQFDADLSKYILDNDVSSSSTYYDSLQTWADGQRMAIAGEYGQDGADVYRYYNETPAQRLAETGYGSGSPAWQQTLRSTAEIAGNLTAAGLSPRGYGEAATANKIWLYRIVEAQRASDSVYDKLWEDLSYALPEKGMSQRDGVPLYEAVLFGQFQTDLIDPSIILAVQTGG